MNLRHAAPFFQTTSAVILKFSRMAAASGRQALTQDITIPLHGDPSEARKVTAPIFEEFQETADSSFRSVRGGAHTLKNTPQHLKITNLTQVKNYYILVKNAILY
ncbi:hypothetical protein AXF13_07985 [Desulfovibrio fairfieldensis]|uniref:Uncharacterized protein n=1 Tax=Desulfovibrio fairfieldensis TaxID=44742 RepID=A0A0X8JJY8_9BACT|nr:hypothetical protein AXF13_07985 [Desulfovibrio fairfieldensis]